MSRSTRTALLDDVEKFIGRFVAFPSEDARVAVTLWAAHTHALARFESTPRLALLSPEPGSGKTRTLEILELLCPRALMTLNASPSALFRTVSDPEGPPTLLLDEADAVFGPRASRDHEDLRAFINGGHRRGQVMIRSASRNNSVTVERFPSFAPVAVAGLGDLPDTIMSRSIVVRMRRRAPSEQVEPFRHRLHAGEGELLRDRLAAWVESLGTLKFPTMPVEIKDRAEDCWEPLIMLADAAGGTWPDRARVAGVAGVADSRGMHSSDGIRLLADLRKVWEADDWMLSTDLVAGLVDLEESPWGELHGRELTARGLAQRLATFGVTPKQRRINRKVLRGYSRSDLEDTFTRYLPDEKVKRSHPKKSASKVVPIRTPRTSATSATPATPATAKTQHVGRERLARQRP